MATPTLSVTQTLTGFLGGDREIRWTEEKTELVVRKNEIAEMDEEHEVTIHARPYAVASLATQEKVEGQWQTVWHRLIAWNPYDQLSLLPLRLARKGDRVDASGYWETVELKDEKGEVRKSFRQFVVTGFSILASKDSRDLGYTPARQLPAVAWAA